MTLSAVSSGSRAFEDAYAAFKRGGDAQLVETFERLRRDQFARLDEGGHIYLDYTGGGLHAQQQLEQHHDLLNSQVFGNPIRLTPARVRPPS